MIYGFLNLALLNMKTLFALSLTVLLVVNSKIANSQNDFDVEININYKGKNDLFLINKKENYEISEYLYNIIIDNYYENINDNLYTNDTLMRVIFSIYKNGINIPENYDGAYNDSYFRRNRVELLFGIENKNYLCMISDMILNLNNDDGLLVGWDDICFTKLNNFEKYCIYILENGNIFEISNLISILHVNGRKYDKLLKRLNYVHEYDDERKKLNKLLNCDDFTREEYFEQIYGGGYW